MHNEDWIYSVAVYLFVSWQVVWFELGLAPQGSPFFSWSTHRASNPVPPIVTCLLCQFCTEISRVFSLDPSFYRKGYPASTSLLCLHLFLTSGLSLTRLRKSQSLGHQYIAFLCNCVTFVRPGVLWGCLCPTLCPVLLSSYHFLGVPSSAPHYQYA